MKPQKLSNPFLVDEYNYYKKLSFFFFSKDKLRECIKNIRYCGTIAWHYPILFDFCDDELEELLRQVKNKLKLNKDFNTEQCKKKVIFYNSQIVNSGGLTEQYLHYFIEHDYEVLFIVPDEKNTKLGLQILQTISENEKIELYIAKARNDLNKIKEIDSVVKKFGAANSFLHFVPNDVIGYAVFSDLVFLKRFFIVHNDHTFWFGKGCSDYFIEFRKFGCCLAVQRRLIDYRKIYQVPYYPIIQKTEFQGFPFNPEGKTIGFSGANLYKYYLDPELNYFKAIKILIEKNDGFIFCLAGAGDNSIFKRFILENKLENRFFLLGRRSDFYALIGHIDILFESYPMKGGLTVLYAVENGKAITGIGNNKTISLPIEDFFNLDSYNQAQNFDNFITEADRLIKDKQYRHENAIMFNSSKFKKSFFTDALTRIINGTFEFPNEKYQKELTLDDNYYLNEYLSLPDSDFSFFYTKLFTLKSTIPLIQRVEILMFCYKLNPIKVKKRKIRLLFLVLTGI